MQLLLGSGELAMFLLALSLALTIFSSSFLEGEAVLKVVIGGIFLHNIFGYGVVFKSLQQGVHYHLVQL